jgi:hypothetical protein
MLAEGCSLDDGIHIPGGTDTFGYWVGYQQPGYTAADKHNIVAQVTKGAGDNEQIFKVRIVRPHATVSDVPIEAFAPAFVRGCDRLAMHPAMPAIHTVLDPQTVDLD